MTNQEILEAIESMTLLQVKELVDEMKEKFGVTGAIAVAGAPAAGGAAAAEAEEKTEFDVVLKDAGSEKI
ncbi:MAG: 50S ribosomal protein L7/L12, partial [Eubacteriales bacterium]